MKNLAGFIAFLTAVMGLNPAPAKPHVKLRPQIVSSAMPPPRAVRQIPGWIPGESTFDGLRAATGQALVIQVTNRRDERVSTRIVALNRGRQNVRWTKEAEGINLRSQSIRATWSVLGSTTASQPTIILQRQILSYQDNGARYETEFYGLDETSRLLWQYPPAKEPNEPANSFTGAPLVGNLLPVHADGSDALILWDAQTGKPIDPLTPEGKAAVAKAIQQARSPLLQAWGKLYHLDTGASLPIPYQVSSSSDEQIVPLGVTADRAFWRVGGDDGFMGHSSWPTSLIASDENGKLLWHFPEVKDSDYLDGDINAPSASSLILVNGTGSDSIVVVPTGGKNGGLYGLRARDGKTLWKRTLSDLADVAAHDPKNVGAFLLRVRRTQVYQTTQYGNPTLEYLNASTGTTQKTWMLPIGVSRIAIAGDDLLTIDENGKIAIYSCRALLGKR